MIRFLWILFILLSISLFASASSPAYQLEVTGQIENKGDKYIIFITGQTDLPGDTRLETEVSYLKKVAVPPIIREETGKDYEMESIDLIKGMTEVKDGEFQFELGYYQRRPYSGKYSAKVRFELASQPQEVRTLLPDEVASLEETIEFSFGSEIDFAKEKAEVKKEIYRDLVRIQKLYEQLTAKPEGFLNNDKWQGQIKSLEEINRSRWEQSIYWLESAGKRTIKWLLEDLTHLGQSWGKEEFQAEARDFHELMEDRLYELGYQKIIDTPKVNALIKSIEGIYNNVKQGKNRDESRAKLELAIFRITQELPEYLFATYVLSLSRDLLDYLALANKPENERRQIESRIEKNFKALQKYLDDFK